MKHLIRLLVAIVGLVSAGPTAAADAQRFLELGRELLRIFRGTLICLVPDYRAEQK